MEIRKLTQRRNIDCYSARGLAYLAHLPDFAEPIKPRPHRQRKLRAKPLGLSIAQFGCWRRLLAGCVIAQLVAVARNAETNSGRRKKLLTDVIAPGFELRPVTIEIFTLPSSLPTPRFSHSNDAIPI